MSTIDHEKYRCPFCGKKNVYEVQTSSYVAGHFLDFRPFGAVIVPSPVPKCPKCKFVFFKGEFSIFEIHKIKKALRKNNFFVLEPDMPSYYYLAKESELLKRDNDIIIKYYVSAIWDFAVGTFSFVKEYKKIAMILIELFEKVKETNENYYVYKLMKLDFYRRLKEFQMAVDLIETLRNDHNFPHDKYDKILDYQLVLVNKNDISAGVMPV